MMAPKYLKDLAASVSHLIHYVDVMSITVQFLQSRLVFLLSSYCFPYRCVYLTLLAAVFSQFVSSDSSSLLLPMISMSSAKLKLHIIPLPIEILDLMPSNTLCIISSRSWLKCHDHNKHRCHTPTVVEQIFRVPCRVVQHFVSIRVVHIALW